MRKATFEPGDGVIEIVVDSLDEILDKDWKDSNTSILLLWGNRRYHLLKVVGEVLSPPISGQAIPVHGFVRRPE